MPAAENSNKELRDAIIKAIAEFEAIHVPDEIPESWRTNRERTIETLEDLVILIDAGKVSIDEAIRSSMKVLDDFVRFITEDNKMRQAASRQPTLPGISNTVTA